MISAMPRGSASYAYRRVNRLFAARPREDDMQQVRAEMVANVWKVVAAAGDQVSGGDTLVILESMKMEISVVAEAAGRVDAVHVAEGDVVQEGDVIAVIA